MNKMTKIFIGLGSIFCLVLLGSSAFSQGYSSSEGYNEFYTAEVGVVYQPMAWNVYEASWLFGHRVLTPLNSELGQIESFVVDKTNGRVVMVVLSDVPNIGAKRLVLPFSSIGNCGLATCEFFPGDMEIGPSLEPNYVINSDPYIYALTLAGKPEFYQIPSSMDVAWLADIYRDYGVAPYWDLEGQQAPSSLELFSWGD